MPHTPRPVRAARAKSFTAAMLCYSSSPSSSPRSSPGQSRSVSRERAPCGATRSSPSRVPVNAALPTPTPAATDVEASCPFCPADSFRCRQSSLASNLCRHLNLSCAAAPPPGTTRVVIPVSGGSGSTDIILRLCTLCSSWSTERSFRKHRCNGAPAAATTTAVAAPPPLDAADARADVDAAAADSDPVATPAATGSARPFGRRRGRLLSYIPASCADAFVAKARHILTAARQASAANDARASSNLVAQFIALPSLTLSLHRRSRVEQSVLRNLRSLAVDPTSNALARLAAPVAQRGESPDSRTESAVEEDDARVTRCLDVLRSSGVSAALRSLVSPPPPPVTDDVIHRLHAMHPAPYPGQPVPAMPTADHTRVNPEKLFAAFSRLSTSAAPGLSGWRKNLLRPLMRDRQCVDGLAFVVEMILNGSLTNPFVRDALLASRLMALSKRTGNGAVRPIAIGDTLIKLAAHYALDALSGHLSSFFHPVQMGLYTRGGVEKVIHATQMLLESNPGHVLFSLDFANAFNERSRLTIARALYDDPRLSSLWRLFDWSYGTPVPLYLFDRGTCVEQLWSSEGVRQGDVLGSFLFALSIQPHLLDVAGRFPSVRVMAIHDDVNIVGPPAAVHQAQQHLVDLICSPPSGPQIDLRVAVGKSQLFSPRPALDDLSAFSGMDVSRTMGGSFKLLGSFIGLDDAAVSQALDEHVRETLFPLIPALQNPFLSLQLRLLFLRTCVSSCFGFLARTSYPARFAEAATEIDAKLLLFLARDCLGLENIAALPDSAQFQTYLPVRLGGLGLQSATVVSDAGFLASAVMAHHTPTIFGFNDFPANEGWSTLKIPFATTIQQTYASVCQQVKCRSWVLPSTLDALLRLRLPPPKWSNSTSTSLPLQSYITQYRAALILAGMIDGQVFPSTARGLPKVFALGSRHAPRLAAEDIALWGAPVRPNNVMQMSASARMALRARLGVLSLRFASLPFTTWPMSDELIVSDPVLRALLALRLGLAPSQFPPPSCANCHRQMDFCAAPFHPFSCASRRSGQTTRHTLLNRTLCGIARSCKLAVVEEVTFPGFREAAAAPAPATLRPDATFDGPEMSCMVDVSVLCSCAPSYVSRCASSAASVLRTREREKVHKYATLAANTNRVLSPVVFDALCVPSEASVALIETLAGAAVTAGIILDSSKPFFIRSSLARLAFAVAHGNLHGLLRPCLGNQPFRPRASRSPAHVGAPPAAAASPSVADAAAAAAAAAAAVADTDIAAAASADDSDLFLSTLVLEEYDEDPRAAAAAAADSLSDLHARL